jgi:small-conductance mechanosensitive channel
MKDALLSTQGAATAAWYALAAVAVIAGTWATTSWLTSMQARLRGRMKWLDRIVAWLPVAQVVIWLGMLALGAWALSGAPVIVVLAFAIPLGLAVVFGARDILSDAVAGAILAFEHSIIAGDIVHVAVPSGEVSGRIVAIGLRRTLLRTHDDAEVVLPNQTLLNSVVRTNREHELDSAVEIPMPRRALDVLEIAKLKEHALEAAFCSRYASLKRHPEFFVRIDEDGAERAWLLAHAFDPEMVRHLQTDVLERIHERLE